MLRGCNFSILAGAGPIRQSSRALILARGFGIGPVWRAG